MNKPHLSLPESEKLDSDWIFQEVGSAINELDERFMSEPFFFYTQQDMHAYVYHKLNGDS
jgi:hypothetical protein